MIAGTATVRESSAPRLIRDLARRKALPVAFLLISVPLLLSRLPMSLVTNFWAEDGAVFYAQAYNLGWLQPLTMALTGYLQTFPRLEAAVAVNFPLAIGPLLASGVALIFDVAPGVFLLTERCRDIVPNLAVRLILATFTVVLPDTFELNGNLANVQWHLPLLSFLLIAARPPRTVVGHALDLLVLAVTGVSGPFCFLLTPICAWLWLRQRARWLLGRLAVLAGVTAIQAGVLITHAGERLTDTQGLLHPSFELLIKILDRPLLTPILGTSGYDRLMHSRLWNGPVVPALVLLVGALLVAYALWRGPTTLRLLFFLAAGVLVMALVSPFAGGSLRSQWEALAGVGAHARYFYIPALVWISALVWLALKARWLILRVMAAAALVCGLVIAAPRDWRYSSPPPTDFQAAAAQFDRAPPGTTMVLPIEPAPAWKMTLHKH
jgi:hypothetical protein